MKRLIIFLAFCSAFSSAQILSGILGGQPPPAGGGLGTFTKKQIVAKSNCSTSSSTCSMTVASTCASGVCAGILVAGGADANTFMTGVTGAGTWTVPAGCKFADANPRTVSCAYNLAETSGVTSFTITWNTSAPNSPALTYYEYGYSGPSVSLDTATTTTNTGSGTGATLTLSGTKDVIVQEISTASKTITSVAASFGNLTTGLANQFYSADNENTSVGTAPVFSAASFTNPTSYTAIALKGN